MNDVASPELPARKEYGAIASWQEIRKNYSESKFSEMYDLAMKQFKRWETSPKTAVDEASWNDEIGKQVEKARGLVGSLRTGAKLIENKDKVAAIGIEQPSFGVEDSTRIYLGVDPRRSTDAFIALLDGLEANGVLKDINVAINLEALKSKQISGNTIIVYDPTSRPDVLNKVLEAYRNARTSKPDAFALSEGQKATIMRWNLRHFHATIDANMSFVEQPKINTPSDSVRSFDEGDALRIQKAFNFYPEAFSHTEGRDYTDEEFLEAVKARESRELFVWEDQQKWESGLIKPGDVMKTERILSAPAIVQRGSVTVKTV